MDETTPCSGIIRIFLHCAGSQGENKMEVKAFSLEVRVEELFIKQKQKVCINNHVWRPHDRMFDENWDLCKLITGILYILFRTYLFLQNIGSVIKTH